MRSRSGTPQAVPGGGGPTSRPTVAARTDVAPMHGDDPVSVRLRRHALGILTVTAAAGAIGAVGAFPSSVTWWTPAVVFLAASLLIAVVYAHNPGSSRREVHTRAAVQTFALATVTYATGWGFALPFVHLFGIADNINESGARAGRTSLGWAALFTLVAQVGLELGVVPVAAVTPRASHLVAGITVVLLALVTNRLRAGAAAREAVQAELARSERRFRTLVEDASDIVLLLDEELTITYASPAVARVLGHHDEQVTGTPYLDLVTEADAVRIATALMRIIGGAGDHLLLEFAAMHRDGHELAVQASHRDLLADPDVGALVVSLRDVSEEVRLQAELEHGRRHDAVTDLPNRQAVEEHVDATMVTNGIAGLAALVVGIDGMDALAETAGRSSGDELARRLAAELTSAMGDQALVGRLSDRRFVAIVAGCDGMATYHTVAERLCDVVDREVAVEDVHVPVTGRVGIAPATPGVQGHELLRAAELALRSARQNDSRIAVFDQSLREAMVQRLQAERELGRAIDEGELRLHYQPLVNLEGDAATPRILGVEALVRWQHPERGLLHPGDFVPLAEETGQVVDLGWWVLETAVTQLQRWDAELGVGAVDHVSVNVSMLQFSTRELAGRVEAVLERSGIAPDRLLLELTETSLAEDPAGAVPQLHVLARMGVKLAIDDFGTGYSSMQYLQQFPVDVLKIDRAFVAGAREDDRPGLLHSLRQLGDVLGLRTVAEGIETADELAAVRGLAFHIGQGYLFGRPGDAADINAAIADQQAVEQLVR